MPHQQYDLAPLDLIVLGLISVRPQTTPSLVEFFQDDSYGWNANEDTLPQIVKRLENQSLLESQFSGAEHDDPQRSYTLTEAGGAALDSWLREVPGLNPKYQQRELAMWRFQFMENRLPRADVLKWIDDYLDALHIYDYGRHMFQEGTIAAMMEAGQLSIHRQLVMEATLMEINMLRTWLEMVRARLSIAHQTNELRAVIVPPES